MGRYQGIKILKDDNGKRYFKSIKYPDIPVSDNDIYFISVIGDRLDNISFDYYGSTDYYWIIAVANSLRCDSLFMEAGTQIRVPADIQAIKREFNKINGIV